MQLEPLLQLKLDSSVENTGTLGNAYDGNSFGVTFDGEQGDFDGSSYIDIPDLNLLGSFALSIEFKTVVDYPYTGAYDNQDILVGCNQVGSSNPSDLGIGIINKDKVFFFLQELASAIESSVSVNDGMYHKVLAVKDWENKQTKLYLDGNLIGTYDFPTMYEETLFSNNYIGKSSWGERFLTGQAKNYILYDSNLQITQSPTPINDGTTFLGLRPVFKWELDDDLVDSYLISFDNVTFQDVGFVSEYTPTFDLEVGENTLYVKSKNDFSESPVSTITIEVITSLKKSYVMCQELVTEITKKIASVSNEDTGDFSYTKTKVKSLVYEEMVKNSLDKSLTRVSTIILKDEPGINDKFQIAENGTFYRVSEIVTMRGIGQRIEGYEVILE